MTNSLTVFKNQAIFDLKLQMTDAYFPFSKGEEPNSKRFHSQTRVLHKMNVKVLNSNYNYGSMVRLQNYDPNKYKFMSSQLNPTVSYKGLRKASQIISPPKNAEIVDVDAHYRGYKRVEENINRHKFGAGSKKQHTEMKAKESPAPKAAQPSSRSRFRTLPSERNEQHQSKTREIQELHPGEHIMSTPMKEESFQQSAFQSYELSHIQPNNQSQFTELDDDHVPNSDKKLSRKDLTRSRSKNASAVNLKQEMELAKIQQILHEKVTSFYENEDRQQERRQKMKELEDQIKKTKERKEKFVYKPEKDDSDQRFHQRRQNRQEHQQPIPHIQPQPPGQQNSFPDSSLLQGSPQTTQQLKQADPPSLEESAPSPTKSPGKLPHKQSSQIQSPSQQPQQDPGLRPTRVFSNVSQISYLIDQEEVQQNINQSLEEINRSRIERIQRRNSQLSVVAQNAPQIPVPPLNPPLKKMASQKSLILQEDVLNQIIKNHEDLNPHMKEYKNQMEDQESRLLEKQTLSEPREISFVDFMLAQQDIYQCEFDKYKLHKQPVEVGQIPSYLEQEAQEIFRELRLWSRVNRGNIRVLIKQHQPMSSMPSLNDIKSIKTDDSDDSIF